jgi:hypothetical protein
MDAGSNGRRVTRNGASTFFFFHKDSIAFAENTEDIPLLVEQWEWF